MCNIITNIFKFKPNILFFLHVPWSVFLFLSFFEFFKTEFLILFASFTSLGNVGSLSMILVIAWEVIT